jgi:ribosomal protein S18 acetylase RimI-like enzyme
MPRANASSAPVAIRSLAWADLDAVVRIDAIQTGELKADYWQQVFRDFLDDQQSSAHRVGLAAASGSQVVGFIFGDVRAFEFGSEPCGWILEIGVDPDFTRAGVASALLHQGCARLRAAGVSVVRTMVRRNNVPVLTFFRTNGFAGGPYVQLELTPDADW